MALLATASYRHDSDTTAGFSLLELMVALVVLAVLTGLLAPNFATISGSFDRLNARSNLLQDLKRAQAESLTKGCRGIFQIAVGGNSYSFGCDFLAYDPASPPSYDQQSFSRTLPSGVQVSASSQIIFNSRGQSVDENDVISTTTITMTRSSSEGSETFVSGTLLGTGLFALD
ncbi:MAG: prepilin-type N-terminal cleavage/methylation domain-containing protein [Bdellovibrionales bacterium]|nr:prepilin-type N-terminal cleavage/methylation domain-containing protein [Bdellovibrionales bacterium]